jgi:ParB-like chromosome segregation protein Spo0J
MRGRLRKYEHEPWRNVLPVHPAAELLPPLSADELQELGEDIRARGLLVPIVLYLDPDGGLSLLDGRNRLDAMERVGIEFVIIATPPSTATLMGDVLNPAGKTATLVKDIDPYAFVVSTNVHRRHLTAERKRELIAGLLKATPEKSNRQIAETVKASPTTVGTVRAEMEAKGDVSKLDTRTDSKGRQQPATKGPQPEQPASPRADQPTLWLPTHTGEMVPYPQPKGEAKFNQTNEQVSWAAWTWNPVTGCLHNCPYCYARELATSPSYAQTYPVGFTPLFHHERLDAPRNTKVPEQAKTDSRYGRSVISSVRCKIITPK